MEKELQRKIKDFIDKTKGSLNDLDLSSDQDLSIALMNLISIEEHFYFSGAKTNNSKYFDLLNEVRQIRKELLKKLTRKNEEGAEIWCLSKHLLAASMRLIEVGTKEMDKGNKEIAYDLFHKAYELYSLFWGINLNFIDLGEIKQIDEDKLSKNDQDKKTVFKDLKHIVRKLVDCCRE